MLTSRRPERAVRPRLGGVAAATVVAGGLVLGGAAPASAAGPDDVVVNRVLHDPEIVESSGLARSALHGGVLWTHNDRGDSARLFAVDRSGSTRAVLRLRDVDVVDVEALARAGDAQGRPALYVGDIGDNSASRPSVAVHVVAEPTELRDAEAPVQTFRFRYEDGPHDAEALLVDPATNRISVVTKAVGGGAVYEAPPRPDPDTVNVLTRVAGAPALVTDGYALWGGGAVLRTYTHLVRDLPGRGVDVSLLPLQLQGESVTAGYGAGSVLVGSEGRSSEVLRVRVR